MNDRELLELAAKAAGMTGWSYTGALGMCKMINSSRPDATGSIGPNWNPLTDDGDALRLAAKLRLGIEFNEASVVASWVDDGYESKEIYGYPDQTQDDDFNIVYTNHDKAARRAIVRAAAEIGRQMQEGGAA